MEQASLRPRLQYHQPPLSVVEPAPTTAELLEGQAMLAAIAEQLLSRIVFTDPGRGFGAAARGQPPCCTVGSQIAPKSPWDEEAPALTDFDLSSQAGRLGFLYALFMHHYRHGLLMAVNHVWASLARPKALRCQIMAQTLKLAGTGKVALKNVLAAFLQETLYGVDFPPLPDPAAYPNSAAWNAACTQHFDGINAQFETIYSRYEAILDGRDPDSRAAAVIKGPWIVRLGQRDCRSIA